MNIVKIDLPNVDSINGLLYELGKEPLLNRDTLDEVHIVLKYKNLKKLIAQSDDAENIKSYI